MSDVVPLREVAPVASDPVGALRRLADRMAAGEMDEDGQPPRAVLVLVIEPDGVHGYGLGRDGTLPLTALMAANFIDKAQRGLG